MRGEVNAIAAMGKGLACCRRPAVRGVWSLYNSSLAYRKVFCRRDALRDAGSTLNTYSDGKEKEEGICCMEIL